MAQNEQMQDYYAILGIPHFSDSPQELRRAYKEQILYFHPDKGNVSENIALERTQLLNEAYKTLKDPEKKAEYDKALKAFLQRESFAAQEKRENKEKKEERPKQETGTEEKPRSEHPKQEQPKAEQPKQAEPSPSGPSKPKPAPSLIPDSPVFSAIKKAAEKAMTIAPVLPKPVLAMIAIVVLLGMFTFIDMIYRAASGIVSPSEIDSGIFTSGDVERELHTACIPFERYRSRFHETRAFLESDDAGYGSALFYASEDLIVMRRDDPPRPLTLTIDYTGSLGIRTEQDSDAASLRFTENVWYGRTTQLTVIPEHPGITVFTFSNDRNDIAFRVRVIVL